MKKLNSLILFFFLLSCCLFLTACQSSKKVENLSITQLEEKIKQKENFVVEIVRTGCSACTSYEPIFEAVMRKYNLDAYTINLADLNEEEVEALDNITFISGTPTTLFFINGRLENSYNKIVGSVSSEALKNRLVYLKLISKK